MRTMTFKISRRIFRLSAVFTTLFAIALLLTGCNSGPEKTEGTSVNGQRTGPIRIGFLLETLKEERWLRDRDLFLEKAKELGATVEIQVADGNDAVQLQQAENMLTKGVDVLVVVPHDGQVAASIVDKAKQANVPVIAYDRLILNSDVALYVSFDNVRVGEMQARYLLERRPKGNYLLICGSPTDNNAKLLYQGQMNVLKPAVDRGDIKIVAEQWATNWQASDAMKHTENALTQNHDDIVAVVASADSVARGVIQALDARGLAEKVLVSGQDADIVASQYVAQGKQAMTVYKPIKPLAYAAAEAAVKLARGEKVETGSAVNNGKIDVPAILLDPIIVDKNNLEDTVIKDGYQKREEVFGTAK